MVKIIGYGSLLNPDEIRKISSEGGAPKPVLVKDFERVLNVVSASARWNVRGLTVGGFGIQEKPGAKMCAVVYDLNDAEFEAFKKREEEYTFPKVKVVSFNGERDMAKAFIAMPKKPNKSIRPIPGYVAKCLLGVKRLDEKFGLNGAFVENFRRTSFTAEGLSLNDYIKKVRKEMGRVRNLPRSEKIALSERKRQQWEREKKRRPRK